MDPITAAGLGLSITSLVLQLFGGCIKGYEIFLDMVGMPAKFAHLLVRMQLERTRLLNWGEKVGLLEEVLEQPSMTLHLHRNLIVDILFEIQRLFKESLLIQDKFASVGNLKEDRASPRTIDQASSQFQPKNNGALLEKALKALKTAAEIPTRLQWALVKQEKFEILVEKLISYNNSIVSLLDRTTIQQIYDMQIQTQLTMLQVSSKVDDLKQLALAIQMQTHSSTPASVEIHIGSQSGPARSHTDDAASFARLTNFKAQQINLDLESLNDRPGPLDGELTSRDTRCATRSLALYGGQRVWIEWKEYDPDHQLVSWPQMIGERVKKLAILLGIEDTPKEFRAPRCLGYFQDISEDAARYGLVYKIPPGLVESEPMTLLDLIQQEGKPSLTRRIGLAHKISESIIYLHAVNWLHKGVRSENIVFFAMPGQMPDLASPTISGFEYARPDLPEELTEMPSEDFHHDIYRHPDAIGRAETRSRKSWDIYSLGVVLVEIAFWKSIADIVGLHETQKGARSKLRRVRDTLLDDQFLRQIGAEVGEIYQGIVRRCIEGGMDLGIPDGADEAVPETGAELQRVFSQAVVQSFHSIRL
ncbi:hypothetical protein LTR84_004637 [Exophiala bonariae]|uniref:Protein kinase domain-containing protein n=1 Tax=Exophiala bonariae TaxID=1690606 RepID=A0AAV9NQ72_9EURO|nr:hypothetical protein LTR84_004637 [Exophiala bonariae]